MITLESEKPTSRKNRYPRHNFRVRARPFQIVPFMIAPVLPAETLESLWFEAREVTDPLASPLQGFKSEFHFFYVKIRDIIRAGLDGVLTNITAAEAATIEGIFTNPIATGVPAGLGGSASTEYYYNGGGVNWQLAATETVIRHHFRDRGEAINAASIGNYYAAQIRERLWMDSMTKASDVNLGGTTIADPNTATTPERLQEIMQQFEALQAYGWGKMSFEDYLATHGIHMPKAELQIPERLFSFSEFKYPSNTVNPSTGAPTSACSWVFKEMKRDAKAFKEPGFILGLHVIRPKVYFDGQTGSLSSFLNNGMLWLPAVMSDLPETSLKLFDEVNASDGPLGSAPTEDYWVDMRDLYLHGDQFQNFASDASAPGAALPTAALQAKYPASADVDEYFAAASPANQVRMDGFASLTIKGWQQDYTRGVIASNV